MSDDIQNESYIKLPPLSEVKQEVSFRREDLKPKEDSFIEEFSELSVKSERSYTHLKGLQDHYDHKNKWSYFIMALMATMVLFQTYLLYKVGSSQWNFEKYTWLLPALLVQNLGQIVGLAVFVVKALFAKWIRNEFFAC